MYCLTCKKVYPDTEDKCPHCGASSKPERCPECWAKLPDGVEICEKCGCDIKRFIKEEEENSNHAEPTFAERIKALPLYVKIAVPAAAAVLAIAIIFIAIYAQGTSRAEAIRHSQDFITQVEDSMETITKIAGYYENDVYNRDWISHIENAEKLREKHADKIEQVEKQREPVTYANDLVADSGDEELAKLAGDVYYAYTACYSYVISEKGKYPHYLDNYNKILDKYNKAVDKLGKAIK